MNPRFFREYHASRTIELAALATDANAFYTLIMAAMRQAGSDEMQKLEQAFPQAAEELRTRYKAPGGFLNQQESAAYRQEE